MLSLDCARDAGGCWNDYATAWRMSLRLAMRMEEEGDSAGDDLHNNNQDYEESERETMKLRCDARSMR